MRSSHSTVKTWRTAQRLTPIQRSTLKKRATRSKLPSTTGQKGHGKTKPRVRFFVFLIVMKLPATTSKRTQHHAHMARSAGNLLGPSILSRYRYFHSAAHRGTRGWLGDGLGLAIRARTPSTWAGSGISCSSWACSFGSPTFREI
jgi:hypothetical protein